MHIPDGFLATPVWLSLDAVALPAVALAARRAQTAVEESRAPLLGVMGAFVFAAQMINFPVGAGTSGHLVGGALLAILLGPAAATVVMTAILALQAFVFQDGGVLALGANVLNMACLGVLAAWIPYRLASARFPRAAAGLAGAASVLASAVAALSELLLSGIRIPPAALWLTCGLFALSAVAEGLITVAVLAAIGRLSPHLAPRPQPAPRWALIGLAAAAALLVSFGVLLASSAPDGIERLLGPKSVVSAAPARLAGLALIGALGLGLGWAARRRSA